VDCRELLRQQAGEAIRFDRSLLEACTRRQILARMLNNLKRIYVELRSFPHARAVTELLLTVEPAVGAGVHGLPSRRVDRKHASRREARVPRGSRDASDAAGAKPLSFLFELRDRGLIAYHLDDYPAALRDLEHYLRLRTWHDADREEHSRVLEHVRTLRGRVAGLN
jgi:regulator of sirC expression with transglutaminase-like and TPR domain